MRNSKMSGETSLRKRTKNISKMNSYIEESITPVSDNIILTPGGPFASSSFVVQGLYKISTLCFTPWCLVLDHFLAIFVRTSDASKTNIIGCCVWTFLLLVALICLTPIAIVGFALWFPLQWWRPRSFSYITPSSGLRESSEKYGRVARPPSISSITPPDLDYGVITANLCLMPEFVAHINNLSDSVGRGGKMAAYFCGEPPHWRSGGEGGKPTEMDCLVPAESADSVNVGSKDYEPIAGDNYDSRSTTSGQWSTTSKERSVSETFPFLSHFVCLQEVFDGRSTDKLISGLRTKYPYIIYDVTQPIHNCRLTLLGSGLCIASLHPFIDILFKPFPCGHHDDKLACKGLLMTKVFLGRDDKGHDLVGFLATTHLQAWSHSHASSVRCRQLDCIYTWMDEFRLNAASRSGNTAEVVLFSIITGDLNFDKTSYFDLNEQRCQFLQHFIDPCIDEQNGLQHSWVVGTELNQTRMHDERVRTPHGLQRMLVSELERSRYVASTVPTRNSLQKVGDGKRRIDYILYEECPHIQMNIKDFKFFTGLATLTDHIPVGMTFSCDIE